MGNVGGDGIGSISSPSCRTSVLLSIQFLIVKFPSKLSPPWTRDELGATLGGAEVKSMRWGVGDGYLVLDLSLCGLKTVLGFVDLDRFGALYALAGS